MALTKTVIVQYPIDNVATTAAVSVETGSEDADYPAANLIDGNIAVPARLTTTSGAWLFTFPAAQRVDVVALGPHNLDAALAVTLQANTSNSWGSPAFAATLTIPAADEDGRRVTVFRDLTQAAGYSATGWQYWRLVTGTNTAALALGEVWLGSQRRTLERNFTWGFADADRRRIVEHETEYGVVVTYDLQVRQQIMAIDARASDADLATLRGWHRSMRGRVYPGLFVPDASVNEARWVRAGRDFLVTRTFTNVNDVSMELEELSHGLPL